MINNENELRSKIYIIRGVQVMLDSDLAEIYGYETKYFNRQIKNNIERFDEDFMFQLSEQEYEVINLRCKIFTSSLDNNNSISKNLTSNWGGNRRLPYAFTEQGIYMLMTVLRGELAVKQSKTLVRIFKQMKDFIVQSQNVLSTPDLLKLSIQITENTKDIQNLKQNMVTKNELSKVIKDFTDPNIRKDYLFLNGETVEADIAYSSIYSSAKKSITIVDNYISLKTLVLLKTVNPKVQITLYSDNIGKQLHKTELTDFCKEYPNINITIKTTNGIYHDRYIFTDFKTTDEKIYHCGGSSKDAGKKTMSISQVTDTKLYQRIIGDLQKNPVLIL